MRVSKSSHYEFNNEMFSAITHAFALGLAVTGTIALGIKGVNSGSQVELFSQAGNCDRKTGAKSRTFDRADGARPRFLPSDHRRDTCNCQSFHNAWGIVYLKCGDDHRWYDQIEYDL